MTKQYIQDLYASEQAQGVYASTMPSEPASIGLEVFVLALVLGVVIGVAVCLFIKSGKADSLFD